MPSTPVIELWHTPLISSTAWYHVIWMTKKTKIVKNNIYNLIIHMYIKFDVDISVLYPVIPENVIFSFIKEYRGRLWNDPVASLMTSNRSCLQYLDVLKMAAILSSQRPFYQKRYRFQNLTYFWTRRRHLWRHQHRKLYRPSQIQYTYMCQVWFWLLEWCEQYHEHNIQTNTSPLTNILDKIFNFGK